MSAVAAIALAVTSLVTGTGAQAVAAAGIASSSDKIRPELAKRVEAKGTVDFWIHFKNRADLSKASAIKDWAERGTAVAAALKKTAAKSQAKIRAKLDSAGAKYQTFWATNAIKVSGGSPTMVQNFAGHDEVDGLFTPMEYKVPEVTEGKSEKAVNGVEWGIANINADDVWTRFGTTGGGITVANIDTGVQFDHPALVNQYRGNNGDGTFDHNYNWFDAYSACANGPCDANGHGTHTMGTMVGSDGGANQIGVAPGVRWIAANGCCQSDVGLIASGQWMLEPTDLNGQNPDASKRPNIINNSWGTQLPSNDPFMEDVTLAWEAAGIFGAWSNGNSGLFGCQTSGSPGSRTSNYSTGAYDIGNNIADFSSRGAGQDGEIKPNISAPGVNIRSSFPGDGYVTISGTSMASPHMAGAVALLWSAAPSLVGDVPATRALLDDTAIDKEDLQCGGTADDNNVYGEGRLDVLALLNAAPIGDTGTLTGTVTDAATGDPIAGATVAVTGPRDRSLTAGADGTYSSLLPVGDYQVAVSAFGYKTETVPATVTIDATRTLNVALAAEPSVTVSGAVTDGSGHGWPLYAKVSVEGAKVSDYTTAGDGRYSLKLPIGATYRIKVESQYPGYETVTKDVVVGSDNKTENLSLTVDGTACTAPGYHLADVGGTTACAPVPGGLVVGTVTDANTHAGVPGAVVTSDDAPNTNATSLAEGGDPSGVGADSLFSALTGEHRFAAAKARYVSGSATVDVVADAATTADFELRAGQVIIDADAISEDVIWGKQKTAKVTVRNTGTEPATVRLGERSGAPTASRWTQIPDYPTPIQDNSVGYHDGIVYSVFGHTGRGQTADMYAYDPDQGSWTKLASPSGPRENAAGEFINGKFYITGGWDPSINNVAKLEIYDPSTNTWSMGAPLPKPYANMGHAVLDGKLYVIGGCIIACGLTDVQVYDPQTDTWTVAASYPEKVSYQACGAVGDILYCAGGTTSTGQVRHSYAYDPGSNSWSRIADLPITLSGSGYTVANGLFLVSGGITDNSTRVTGEGFAYDPVTGTWTRLPLALATTRGGSALGFYRVGGREALGSAGPVATAQVLAGYDQGESADIPWLAESQTRLILQPGKKAKVTVTLDASRLPDTRFGEYTGEIVVQTDTPYAMPAIPVSMRVAPPKS